MNPTDRKLAILPPQPGVDISVVVCTYNREEMLRLALASVASQITDGKLRYEIVVVDDASTDGTINFIREFGAGYANVPVRYIRAPGQGVAHARSVGVKAATGEWLAFFDDDQVADPNWLGELYNQAIARAVPCVGGRVFIQYYRTAPRGLSPIVAAVLGACDYGDAPRRCDRKTIPGTGNVLINRRIFDQVGSFDESLTRGGEDLDFFRRVRQTGFEAWYAPNAIVHHLTPSYRLEEDYLFATSRRAGDNFACRDYREWGMGKTLLSCLGRLAQAGLINLPLLWWARFRGDGPELLGRKCLLWRLVGYLRGTLFLLSPRWFAQDNFFRGLDFRRTGRGLV